MSYEIIGAAVGAVVYGDSKRNVPHLCLEACDDLTASRTRRARPHVKVNLDIGVRFGLSLSQGNRRAMEDTATYLADAFGIRRKGFKTQRHSEELSTISSGAAAAAPTTPTGDPTNTQTPAAAYFGIYDGAVSGRNLSLSIRGTLRQGIALRLFGGGGICVL